jgi:hypothetical protein
VRRPPCAPRRYLDLTEGETVIMGKRSLHVTDFRPLFNGARPPARSRKRLSEYLGWRRMTMVVRVLVRPSAHAASSASTRHGSTRNLAVPVWLKCPLFGPDFARTYLQARELSSRGGVAHTGRAHPTAKAVHVDMERHTAMFWPADD